MGVTNDGILGEQRLFTLLRKSGFEFFQADGLGKRNGVWYLFESKRQERYEPPPFEGHGLPLWQVRSRVKFQKETGIIAVLVIFEKGSDSVFYQRLDKLELGNKIDTRGLKPRRIYDLNSFHKL